jgi:hypothetical protein
MAKPAGSKIIREPNGVFLPLPWVFNLDLPQWTIGQVMLECCLALRKRREKWL